jgi:chemotaxis protein histidine kinase CheA
MSHSTVVSERRGGDRTSRSQGQQGNGASSERIFAGVWEELSAVGKPIHPVLAENILRVDAERIDSVLNLVGEPIIGRSMLQQAFTGSPVTFLGKLCVAVSVMPWRFNLACSANYNIR